jgi:hypothetical protein
VKHFADEEKKAVEMMGKIKRWINRAISFADIFFSKEEMKWVEAVKPLMEAMFQSPEKLLDMANENLEALCVKSGIPSHHMMISWAKPAAIELEDGRIVKNNDIRAEISVFNPYIEMWCSVPWDIRNSLRASRNKAIADSIGANLMAAYNQNKPSSDAPAQ